MGLEIRVWITLLSGTFGLFAGSPEWVPLTNQAPRKKDKNTPKGPFTEITLPEYGYTPEIGKPKIPVIREFLEIPEGTTITCKVTGSVFKEFTL